MAEPVAAGPFGGLDLRRIGLIASVSVVIIIALIFMIIRGCGAVGGGNNYTTIYSNLELKDAANVVARLKELKIPYEIRESGQSIAVPKEHADSARLGLAEKNLPAGGAVGWEIFDESKLGATDFDRRIQLIRAISGELSRTIRSITAVQDARVQIVMPETKLFETESVPVTASVLLRLKPGTELIKEKVNGIVHLVASSVENLQTENVTVVDQSGKILTVKEIYVPPIQEVFEETVEIVQESPVTTTTLVQKETTEEVAVVAAIPLTPEERMLLKVRAKKELERDLAGKAQEILNRFYPPNSVIIKIETETNGMPVHKDYQLQDLEINKLNAIILIDNRVDLTKSLKDSTYKSVAAAVGYDKKRGDKILLQKVPFHLATPPPPVVKGEVKKTLPPPSKKEIKLSFAWFKIALWVFGIGLGLLIISSWIRSRKKTNRKAPSFESEVPATPAAPPTRRPGLNQLKNVADQNPEKIADLLRSWLSE